MQVSPALNAIVCKLQVCRYYCYWFNYTYQHLSAGILPPIIIIIIVIYSYFLFLYLLLPVCRVFTVVYGIQCCSYSVYPVCAACNSTSHVKYVSNCTLVLSEARVQCQVWLCAVVPWFHASPICFLRIFWMILTWFQLPLLLLVTLLLSHCTCAEFILLVLLLLLLVLLLLLQLLPPPIIIIN